MPLSNKKSESGLNIISAENLTDAAKQAVNSVKLNAGKDGAVAS